MIKVAVIGSGYWGKNLVRNFHALGALGVICDKDPQVLSKSQKMYPGILGVNDLNNLRDDSFLQVDALVISTPANFLDLTLYSLRY